MYSATGPGAAHTANACATNTADTTKGFRHWCWRCAHCWFWHNRHGQQYAMFSTTSVCAAITAVVGAMCSTTGVETASLQELVRCPHHGNRCCDPKQELVRRTPRLRWRVRCTPPMPLLLRPLQELVRCTPPLTPKLRKQQTLVQSGSSQTPGR